MYMHIKNAFLYFIKKAFNAFYILVKKPNLNKKKVVFVVSREKSLKGNLASIYKELQKRPEKYEITILQTANKFGTNLFKEIFILRDTKYIIIDDYFLPIYLLNLDEDIKVIQVWHAAGALKKFGYSTIGKPFGPSKEYLNIIPIHSNYTHVYVSADYAIPYYAEAFNISSERIKAYGLPRVENFIRNKETNLIEKLNLTDEIIVLYAPTYRANGKQRESSFDILSFLESIQNRIPNEITVVFKGHPYMNVDSSVINQLRNIIDVSSFDVEELMLISDALITDYSSIIFDYSLLSKPIAHYIPDLLEYKKNRGLYTELKDVSDGDLIYNEDEMIKWMKQRSKKEYFDTNRMIELNFSNQSNVSELIVNDFLTK